MLPFSVAHESLHFTIPAAQRRELIAWISDTDRAYLQSEIDQRGFATVIHTQGRVHFEHITNVEQMDASATPFYGEIGGAYRFHFTVREDEAHLHAWHFATETLKLRPYESNLRTRPQFHRQTEATNHWYMNRLEFLREKSDADYPMFIDGDMFANLLASGWQQSALHEYRYEFLPSTVGCFITVRHLASGAEADLTANFEW